MELWIPITLLAATAQTIRFVLQKRLKGTVLSTAGATFARFVYSAPIAVVIALAYSQSSAQAIPGMSWEFWAYAVAGGTTQILGTVCMVALFAQRHFAVGITFKKTEVLMSVLVGLILLGEGVSWLGFGAIVLGLLGVVLLSDPPGGEGHWIKRICNRAAAIGLASGVLFAISGVGYRGASLSLEGGDAFQRAMVTLACVTTFQVSSMAVWLVWRERGEIMRVMRAWRVAGLVGLMSLVGSGSWFTAFTLQTVAYVNAVGQIEVILSLMAGALIFGERISRREWQGVILVGLSVVALILVT